MTNTSGLRQLDGGNSELLTSTFTEPGRHVTIYHTFTPFHMLLLHFIHVMSTGVYNQFNSELVNWLQKIV